MFIFRSPAIVKSSAKDRILCFLMIRVNLFSDMLLNRSWRYMFGCSYTSRVSTKITTQIVGPVTNQGALIL